MSISVRMLAAGTALALGGGLLAGTANADPSDRHTGSAAASSSEHATVELAARRVSDTGQRGTSAAEYWTPKRMASAKPADVEARPGDLAKLAEIPAIERVAPGKGAEPIEGDVAAARTGERKTYSRKVGKMFYKFGKQRWVCSGSVVNSKQKNMVVTAAHCLWDKKKGWAKKIIFVPGYKKGGKSPFGRWYAELSVIPRHWKKWGGRKELPQADYGIMLVEKVGGGKDIAKKVGAYGLQWGKSFKRKFRATGYPAFHTSGDVQKTCKGRSHKWKKYSNPKAGWGLLKMKCRAVTGGSSGGPWLHKRYINGQNALVNSFKRPRWVATPWFAGGVRNIYKKYRNKDPR